LSRFTRNKKGAAASFRSQRPLFSIIKAICFLFAQKNPFHFPTGTGIFLLASVEIDTSVDRANLTDDLRDLLQNLHNFYLLPSWDGHIMPFIYEEEANRL
jgi:hypothetical protein